MKKFSANTSGSYYFISDKKCLVLYLDNYCYVKSGIYGKQYSHEEINSKFFILDNLYYLSYSENSKVIYMELD